MAEQRDDAFVPGTPAERIGMVWPLTKELYSPAGYNVEQKVQRDVTRVIRRKA